MKTASYSCIRMGLTAPVLAAVSLICGSADAQQPCGFPALRSPICGPGPGVVPRSPSSASPISGATQSSALPGTKNFIFRAIDVPGAGTDPGQGTVPAGILPDGTITGGIYDANSAFHAWVRSPNGTITKFDAPGVGTGFHQGTFAWAMNPAGAITGSAIDASDTYHGFLRRPDGTFILFDAPGAGTGFSTLLGFGLGTHGFNINTAGEIAGNYWDANSVPHAFVRAPNGAITTFDAPGAGNSPGQGTFYAYFNFQAADSYDCGQGFQLIADSHSNPSRTAFR
jgi:hypothetical protein